MPVYLSTRRALLSTGTVAVAGGGEFTDPLSYDANLLGYWENDTSTLLKTGPTPVTSDGDLVDTWVDLSSAGNDLVATVPVDGGVWRPGSHGGSLQYAHANRNTADLASAYTGDNLAWFAKVAIDTLTNNSSRVAVGFPDATADTAATSGIFLISQTTPVISMYRNSGGAGFGDTTPWSNGTLIDVACWFNSGTMDFYVDGVLIGSTADASGNFNLQNFRIGNGTASEYGDFHLVRHCLAKDLDTEKFDNLKDWFIAS